MVNLPRGPAEPGRSPTMFSRRFTMRTLLVMLGITGVVHASGKLFHDYHRLSAVREIDAIEKQVLDIYGYESASLLPKWLTDCLPADTARDFQHVTEIDLQFNDLSYCDPADVVALHSCKWVRTIRVPNATMTREMFDAVMGFPNLRELYVRDWFDRVPEHDVILQSGVVSGIKIVCE